MISFNIVSWSCLIFFKGTARYAKTAFPTMPVQLCTDYKTVTSIITPEKKASLIHSVSSIFIVIFMAHIGEKNHFISVAA